MIIAPTTRFHDLIELVLAHEGGYVAHPKDPGGATNMGITLATLSNWRALPQTPADVQDLTRLEAKQIYMAYYWNPIRGDDLPVGVDYMAFDFAVNGGVSRSAKFLQECVGTEQDGAIGPLTVQACTAIAPVAIVRAFHDVKMAFYREARHPKTKTPLWPTFGKGWSRRALEVRQSAYSMLGYRPNIGEE